MSVTPEQARAWLAQITAGHAAVAEVEARELAALDDATALAQSDALLAIGAASPIPAERVTWSGLVEQQRLFARARR